ncbi:MAG: hypothetical protein ACT4P1_15800 [Sporichthyaceae bacterium]
MPDLHAHSDFPEEFRRLVRRVQGADVEFLESAAGTVPHLADTANESAPAGVTRCACRLFRYLQEKLVEFLFEAAAGAVAHLGDAANEPGAVASARSALHFGTVDEVPAEDLVQVPHQEPNGGTVDFPLEFAETAPPPDAPPA